MLRIVKLLRSEVPEGVSGTLNFTLYVCTILHSGIAATSLGEAKHNRLFANLLTPTGKKYAETCFFQVCFLRIIYLDIRTAKSNPHRFFDGDYFLYINFLPCAAFTQWTY